MSATLEMETLMTTLRGATDEQWLAFMKLYNERGVPQFFASVDPKKAAAMAEEADEAAAAVKAEPKPKAKAVAKAEKEPKEPKPKKEKETIPLPSGEDGEPDASEYRVSEADVDNTTCVGRIIDGGADKRWAPIIFGERQCGKKVVEDGDLCSVCQKREEKYAEAEKPGGWTGRITEEPLDWVHMLGTTWAEEKKPKWKGSSVAGSVAAEEDSGSVASASEPKAKKEVKAKLSAEEKEAAATAKKEAAEAKKEAAATAKKEAAEATKAAKKAEKEAAATAKKEAAEAEKAAKKAEKPAAKPKPKAEKKAAVAAEPTEVEDELTLIGTDMYVVKDGDVYEWDATAEKRGVKVGRLRDEDGELSIEALAE
jgi:hypothetical protein